MRSLGSLLSGCLAAVAVCHGAVFYADPVNGRMENDGSMDHPWNSLQRIFKDERIETRIPDGNGRLVAKNAGAPVKAGDTIRLLSGYHGDIEYAGAHNRSPVTIEAAPGCEPRLRRISLKGVSNWVFRGLTISPSAAPEYQRTTMLSIKSDEQSGASHDIVIRDCVLYSIDDASEWTKDDWDTKSCTGIQIGADRSIVRNNQLRNVNHGIASGGRGALVEHNLVENFAGDGIRGLGDDSTYQFNLIRNCYKVNSNHDDGFQSWSRGPGGPGSGVVRNVKLIGNIIIDAADPNQPFRGSLQGIGCFDGMFENWTVENNVIVSDVYHGIALYGAKNCRIINNTVIDGGPRKPRPWILVTDHKNGTQSSDCVVRNNLCATIKASGRNVIKDHNAAPFPVTKYFVDAVDGDLHLRKGSPAIDSGSPDLAPDIDVEGHSRPQGKGVDVGAFEYQPE